MMDGIKQRDLANMAIVTHFMGGLFAGVSGHILFVLFG
jgi:hypothetical protein